MIIRCDCGQPILVNTVGTQKNKVYYNNEGDAIASCPKCGKELSNKN